MSTVERFIMLLLIVVIALPVAGCSAIEAPQDRAARDYQDKLDLVQAQQLNVEYCMNITRGKMVDQPTLESTLDAQYPMISNLALLTDDATASGVAYMQYLPKDSSEYANVSAWQTQMSDYLTAAKAEYNSGVAIYNQFWGSVNGTKPYL